MNHRISKFIYFTVKTNYYRLARIWHPDRVDQAQKMMAQEKFAAIQLAYSVLSDPERKKAFDAGDSKSALAKTTRAGKWEQYMQPVGSDDIKRSRNEYQGSLAEQNDVIREIVKGQDSITHLLNSIPFMRTEDESRIVDMIKRFIDEGQIPKLKIKKLRK